MVLTMTEGEEDYYKYAMYHTISDFSDLSISEIITLQFLVRYSNPVVRHTLFNEVKQFIEFQEKSPYKETDFFKNLKGKKKLTTGKFYHSLSKLKDKGLLEFDGEVGKVSVKPTQFTNYVSNSSWTRPSFTSIITGLPKKAHHIEWDGNHLKNKITTLAERFRSAGYRTHAIVGNQLVQKLWGFGQGFG